LNSDIDREDSWLDGDRVLRLDCGNSSEMDSTTGGSNDRELRFDWTEVEFHVAVLLPSASHCDSKAG
jgi:hypothetical protein